MTTLSPWIVVDGYCATRVLVGSDPDKIENRYAFIEKTPRVRIRHHRFGTDNYGKRIWYDGLDWVEGPKGSGGGTPEVDLTYGFDPASREWCDKVLVALGYDLQS
jgi:hypothetical protein